MVRRGVMPLLFKIETCITKSTKVATTMALLFEIEIVMKPNTNKFGSMLPEVTKMDTWLYNSR